MSEGHDDNVPAFTQPPLSQICSQIVTEINKVLSRYIRKLDGGEQFQFSTYPGNPDIPNDTHKCTETISFPGLYYAVSGSYGLEYIMTDEQRKLLYASDVGAADVDIKIIFDEDNLPQFVKNAIAESENHNRYTVKMFYHRLMMKIIRALKSHLSPGEGWLMELENVGLLFNTDQARFDIVVAPLSTCASLKNFLDHI
jgi:hypothetical protein